MRRIAVAPMCRIAGAITFLVGVNLPALAQQAPPPIAVGTVSAERKAISRSGVLVGRVEAVQRVEVRARVTGYLEEVLFKLRSSEARLPRC